MSPKHSIGFCPICGGGLCGVRICGVDRTSTDAHLAEPVNHEAAGHGFVICDECDATWLLPDLETAHQYPDLEKAVCPICCEPLWGETCRWADWQEIESIGWEFAVDRDLDAMPDEGVR